MTSWLRLALGDGMLPLLLMDIAIHSKNRNAKPSIGGMMPIHMNDRSRVGLEAAKGAVFSVVGIFFRAVGCCICTRAAPESVADELLPSLLTS